MSLAISVLHFKIEPRSLASKSNFLPFRETALFAFTCESPAISPTGTSVWIPMSVVKRDLLSDCCGFIPTIFVMCFLQYRHKAELYWILSLTQCLEHPTEPDERYHVVVILDRALLFHTWSNGLLASTTINVTYAEKTENYVTKKRPQPSSKSQSFSMAKLTKVRHFDGVNLENIPDCKIIQSKGLRVTKIRWQFCILKLISHKSTIWDGTYHKCNPNARICWARGEPPFVEMNSGQNWDLNDIYLLKNFWLDSICLIYFSRRSPGTPRRRQATIARLWKNIPYRVCLWLHKKLKSIEGKQKGLDMYPGWASRVLKTANPRETASSTWPTQ